MLIENDSSIIATRYELLALAAHASKDVTRPHVNGVLFAFARGYAVTTDGHRLARVDLGGVSSTPDLFVPLEQIVAVAKATPAKAGWVARISASGATVHAERHLPLLVALPVTPGDASRFPPFEQVIPAYPCATPTAKIGVSATYLAALELVVKANNSAGGPALGVTLYPPADEIDPLVFTCDQWLVVIMPMRI